MAGALIRRKVGAGGVFANDEDRDTVPSYLLEFPGAISRIKDLNLAVLMGRQVKLHMLETARPHVNTTECSKFVTQFLFQNLAVA